VPRGPIALRRKVAADEPAKRQRAACIAERARPWSAARAYAPWCGDVVPLSGETRPRDAAQSDAGDMGSGEAVVDSRGAANVRAAVCRDVREPRDPKGHRAADGRGALRSANSRH
jgi:hypothetical protein